MHNDNMEIENTILKSRSLSDSGTISVNFTSIRLRALPRIQTHRTIAQVIKKKSFQVEIDLQTKRGHLRH